MRRCYQIALEGIPQSKWDLRDYMEMVRMWNLARGVPYHLVLDSDPRGMVVMCRGTGKVLLGLTHLLEPYQVDEALRDVVLLDWDASVRRTVEAKLGTGISPSDSVLNDLVVKPMARAMADADRQIRQVTESMTLSPANYPVHLFSEPEPSDDWSKT